MNILIGAAMYNDLCLFVKLTIDRGGGAVGVGRTLAPQAEG